MRSVWLTSNLQLYSELRLKNASSEGERLAAEFVLKLLKKRLFSSPAAFGITLEKHMDTIAGPKSTSNYARDIEAYEDDYADDEEYESQIAEATGSASQALSSVSIEEKSLLKELSAYAAKASLRPDSKAQALIKWLHHTLKSWWQMEWGARDSIH
jgi:hypothetical protein